MGSTSAILAALIRVWSLSACTEKIQCQQRSWFSVRCPYRGPAEVRVGAGLFVEIHARRTRGALTVISTPSSARMSAAYDEASSEVDIVSVVCGLGLREGW